MRIWFIATPNRELRKCNARGMRFRALVGGIFGASILPYNLDGTRARHNKFSKKRGHAQTIRVFIWFSYGNCVFLARVRGSTSWARRLGKAMMREMRAEFFRRWFAATPNRELRKCNARGMRFGAPVGGIYGASILPYDLDGTRARHNTFSKKRGHPTHFCTF